MKTLTNILLYLFAIVLSIILLPIGLAFAFFKMMYRQQFKELPKRMAYKFLKMAEGVDVYGNIVCAELFNSTLITKEANQFFGNRKETISSVLGKNELTKTLTSTGTTINKILNFLDPGHTARNIDYNLKIKNNEQI